MELITTVDIRWGYNTVQIVPEDQHKAAFITNQGLFELTVMFFGLTNSPATFQTMMDTIFCEQIMRGTLTVYMDNIVVHTKWKCNTTITGPQIAQLYYKHIYLWFGLPAKVISNRGPRFMSHFGCALAKELGIMWNMSMAYHPQTDGLTERKNQWLE
jgi:hypothetical protein